MEHIVRSISVGALPNASCYAGRALTLRGPPVDARRGAEVHQRDGRARLRDGRAARMAPSLH